MKTAPALCLERSDHTLIFNYANYVLMRKHAIAAWLVATESTANAISTNTGPYSELARRVIGFQKSKGGISVSKFIQYLCIRILLVFRVGLHTH